MARLMLAVLLVGLLLAGLLVMALGLRAAWRGVEQGGTDMAENGMLPKLAFALLLALILYVAVWG